MSVARVTLADRLTLTLTLAILLHALFILGITFVGEEEAPRRFESLRTTLVDAKNEAPPEDAWAQTRPTGDDEDTDTLNPDGRDPPARAEPAKPPGPQNQTPPQSTRTLLSESMPPGREWEMPDRERRAIRPAQTPTGKDDAPHPRPIARRTADHARLPDNHHTIAPGSGPKQRAVRPAQIPTGKDDAPHPRPIARRPSNHARLPDNRHIITPDSELKQRAAVHAQHPRRKFISADTREHKYAAYMDAWRERVERVGNENYPSEAHRHNLSGSLILVVALKPDGSVHEVTLHKSSGHQVLDNAARRIVAMAAPYPPMPDDIRREVDILYISRTWKFNNNRFAR